MEYLHKSAIGFLALSTMCGVFVHDTNLDKATVQVISRKAGSHDYSVSSPSSHPHTHSERGSLGSRPAASVARDPRDDKMGQKHNVDYLRLPGSSNADNTLVLA